MKIWMYVVTSVFLAILFELAGLSIASETLNLIGVDLVAGTSAIKQSTFWVALIAILAAAAVAGITIGFFTKSSSENYVILPFIVAEIALFLLPMMGIVTVAKAQADWIFYITLLIMAPLIIGFGVALYEHFRGTD